MELVAEARLGGADSGGGVPGAVCWGGTGPDGAGVGGFALVDIICPLSTPQPSAELRRELSLHDRLLSSGVS